AELLAIEQGHLADDVAVVLELLDPPRAGRGRQADALGQLLVGDARVALQFGEDAQIVAVQLVHLLVCSFVDCAWKSICDEKLRKWCCGEQFSQSYGAPGSLRFPTSFLARTICPAAPPNQAPRRRRSHRIVQAPGSAPPNQAGDESGDTIAVPDKSPVGEVERPPLFLCVCGKIGR